MLAMFLKSPIFAIAKCNGLVVQLVRMPACHAGGRGFESRPDRSQFQKPVSSRQAFFVFILHASLWRGVVFQSITGKSERYGRALLCKIKTYFGKQPHQFVTVQEFAEYSGISQQIINDYLQKVS